MFLAPGIRLASRSVVFITWRPPPLVFGVELACLLEDPTVSVGVISWLIRVAVNLTRSVQYPVKGGWSVLFVLKWLLPLTGFGATKSGVDRLVLGSFIIVSYAVFGPSEVVFVVPGLMVVFSHLGAPP